MLKGLDKNIDREKSKSLKVALLQQSYTCSE